MKKAYPLTAKLIALLLIPLITSGCWDSRELDTLSIVTGVGIDQTQQPDMVDVTVQVGKVNQSSGSKDNGGSEGSAYLTLKSTKSSIFEAVRSLTHENSRRLFFEHNQVIVFGREQAEKGIQPYLDFFMRDHETRMEVWVLVADEDASTVLSTDSELEKIPAIGLVRLIKNQEATSEAFGVTLLDVASKLNTRTDSMLVPVVKILKQGETSKPSITDMAVFKKDKLVGELTKSEARGYAWTADKISSSILELITPDGKASLEVARSKSKTEPVIRPDGKIEFSVEVRMQGKIGELSGFQDMDIGALTHLLEQLAANRIKKEVLEAFTKAQQLNSDIFGLGEAIHRKHPKYWETIEDKWDEIFPTVQLKVEAEVKLRGTGKILKALNTEEQDKS